MEKTIGSIAFNSLPKESDVYFDMALCMLE